MNASEERTKSLWMDDGLPVVSAPRLDRDLTCDIVIVGGGFAGLSAAYELSIAGRSVVVVDRGRIGGGMTARTTAHLAPVCDDLASELINMRGKDIAWRFHESQFAAVNHIEIIVQRHGIACDFRRLDGYLFPHVDMKEDEAHKQLDAELEAARILNVRAEKVSGIPLAGMAEMPALRYPNQATFHPLAYMKALAGAISDAGGRIYAQTAVTGADEKGEQVELDCEGGLHIRAAQAIFATNSPVNNAVAVHSKMAPYRTYAMAFDLAEAQLPDALYWDLADPYHYVRRQPRPEGKCALIVGGQDHKAGEDNDGEVRFEALETWIRRLVPDLGGETHRWSGQVLDTIDYCGFIGRNPGSERIYIATGDSGQGITHGALAGILLKQLIVDGGSPWEETYDPSRKTVSGIGNYISENLTAVENMAEYLTAGELASADDLAPGQGGILREGLKKLAVCRDYDGILHAHSAACTHLGCIVHWNTTEQCWDCPCHGSHFAPDGSVLNGPALRSLERVRFRPRTIAGGTKLDKRPSGYRRLLGQRAALA